MAHKIALDLNNHQRTYMMRAAGVARFAYNWALEQWGIQYRAWREDNTLPKPSQFSLRKQLNEIKKESFPWMLEVTKCAPQLAIIQLGEAFKNFFAHRAAYPKFRKKGVHDRFSISNDQFAVQGTRIRIPKLGWVRMREALRFSGKLVSAAVSRMADRWFVSITVGTEDRRQHRNENQEAVGVDLGVSALATLSTGEVIQGPKAYSKLVKRLVRLSRSLSRKERGSKNREKARRKLARLHARIANIRQEGLHQLTTSLARRFSIIGIEGLNVRGMLKNRRLSRSIADGAFYEFRRQLEYKSSLYGGTVVVADRWFASSKTCSDCGYRLEALPLSVRHWVCPECGAYHDRDVNAAINLRNNAVSSTVQACGEEGYGFLFGESETGLNEAGS